jgi:hypothetical protein
MQSLILAQSMIYRRAERSRYKHGLTTLFQPQTDLGLLPRSSPPCEPERFHIRSTLPTLITHGFGGRFTKQSPCLTGIFQHEQSRRCSSSNSPINRARKEPGNARDLTRLQTRWRAGLELLNRPAWNDSGALDEADKRQSDRGTIPTPIGRGFRRWIDVQSRCNAGSFQPGKAEVIPARIRPLTPPAISGESLVL